MSRDVLDVLVGDRREAAWEAMSAVVGPRSHWELSPVSGGASGASIFRVEAGGRRYLLRVEGAEIPRLPRNPHRHVCARLAAEAGVAPAIGYLDEAAGVMVTDFIENRPLRTFPGGDFELARALGALASRVQALPAFPPLVDYLELMERRLNELAASGRFVAGALEAHRQRLAAVRTAWANDPPAPVPSHNDPNRGNILFDGERLWLIDWETAYRNDPFVDVAIMLDGLSSGVEFEAALLQAWLGRAPREADLRRLALGRSLTRLYMACFLLNIGAASEPRADLVAPSAADLRRAVLDGVLPPGTPQRAQAFGRIYLDGFLTGAPVPGLASAVDAAMG